MYFQFANVLVFFLLAFVLCGLMLGLGLLLRPSNPHPGYPRCKEFSSRCEAEEAAALVIADNFAKPT